MQALEADWQRSSQLLAGPVLIAAGPLQRITAAVTLGMQRGLKIVLRLSDDMPRVGLGSQPIDNTTGCASWLPFVFWRLMFPALFIFTGPLVTLTEHEFFLSGFFSFGFM